MSKLRNRSKEEAECIRELSRRGWLRRGRNGQGHERMIWPALGVSLIIPGKGPRHFFVKVFTAAKRIESGDP